MFGKQHSEEYVAAYRDGFHDGADCKQNFKLHLLGYEVGELLKIISEYEMQNIKKIDVVDESLVKIYRNGKLVYSDVT